MCVFCVFVFVCVRTCVRAFEHGCVCELERNISHARSAGVAYLISACAKSVVAPAVLSS